MSELIEVALRNQSGAIQTLRVLEIVSIDGQPHNINQIEDIQSCYQAIRHLEGRLEAIEGVIQTLISPLLPERGDQNGSQD